MTSRLARLTTWAARHRIPLVAAVLHVTLAVYFSISYPILESSDENTHFFFVWRLSRTGSIPDVRYEAGPWDQEATQGPLYYCTAALPVALVDTRDAEDFVADMNPFANVGDAARPGNKNLFIHDPRREGWPWHGTTLAVYLARWVSAMYGAVTVWATYAFVRCLLPRAAAAAALFVALLPQLIWASGSVTNDTAIAATSAVVLWILVAAPRDWPLRWLAALGLGLGMAVLSKLPGLLLTVFVSGWMVLISIARGWRTAAGRMAVMALGFILVAGPWLLMNTVRYGDPTALGAHLNQVGHVDARPYSVESILQIFTPDFMRLVPAFTAGIIRSLWGVFGTHNIAGPAWVYDWFNSLAAIGAAGYAVHVMAEVAGARGEPRPGRIADWWDSKPMAQVYLPVWLLINLAFLLVWNSRAGGVAGRLLFPALPVIALMCAAGWWRLTGGLPPVAGRPMQALQPATLGLFALLSPAWIIAPAYARPHPVSELPASATPLHLHYDALELVGIDSQAEVAPGQDFAVTYYWRLTRAAAGDYVVFPRLLDGRMTPVAGTNAYPGWGSWPVRFWEPGVIYEDRYILPVAPDAARPSLGRVILAVEVDKVLQVIQAADGNRFDPTWPLAEVALRPEAPGTLDAPDGTRADFGDSISLLSADFEKTARAGQAVQVRLVWKARRPTADSWQRFVHLDDGNRAQPTVLAQSDGIPADGFGTRWWKPGDSVPDTVSILIPADLPPGEYALWLGFADPAGQRVPIADGESQDGRLYLGAITVRAVQP
jgi:4-amino-4-deoxy-L-arabinose transferase-like glycosyltransferase